MDKNEIIIMAINRAVDILASVNIKYRSREFTESNITVCRNSCSDIIGIKIFIPFNDSKRSQSIMKAKRELKRNSSVNIQNHGIYFEFIPIELNNDFVKTGREFIDRNIKAIFSAMGCSTCHCKKCLLYHSSRCPHGGCYDDKRAVEYPYNEVHPNEPPRKQWSNWMKDQAYWCRGGTFYMTTVCSEFLEYKGCSVINCKGANIVLYQDNFVDCTLLHNSPCEGCPNLKQ